MRVLVCSVYREPSGHGRACRDWIRSLHEAGADVACRPVQFTGNQKTTDPLLQRLEKVTFPGGADVVFQHVPPYAMQRVPGLNIGSFFAETRPLPVGWAIRAQQMDALIVTDPTLANTVRACAHVQSPVYTIPLPCDLTYWNQDCPVPPLVADFARDRFVFYCVGEFARRKGFSTLVRAFISEFSAWEPVGLLLKTGIAGLKTAEASAKVRESLDAVVRGAKLAVVPPIQIVTDRLTDAEIVGIHRSCHCYVQPSFGENWSYGAMDALLYGKTPIVSRAGGFLSYLDSSCAWLVPTYPEPVHGEGDVHAELFSGRQTWDAPDVAQLQKAMREAYTNASRRKQLAEVGVKRALSMSYASVGRQLLRAFDEQARTGICRLEGGPGP